MGTGGHTASLAGRCAAAALIAACFPGALARAVTARLARAVTGGPSIQLVQALATPGLGGIGTAYVATARALPSTVSAAETSPRTTAAATGPPSADRPPSAPARKNCSSEEELTCPLTPTPSDLGAPAGTGNAPARPSPNATGSTATGGTGVPAEGGTPHSPNGGTEAGGEPTASGGGAPANGETQTTAPPATGNPGGGARTQGSHFKTCPGAGETAAPGSPYSAKSCTQYSLPSGHPATQ
jgi:hypothetical protein